MSVNQVCEFLTWSSSFQHSSRRSLSAVDADFMQKRAALLRYVELQKRYAERRTQSTRLPSKLYVGLQWSETAMHLGIKRVGGST